MTLKKLASFSVPQFMHVYRGNNNIHPYKVAVRVKGDDVCESALKNRELYKGTQGDSITNSLPTKGKPDPLDFWSHEHKRLPQSSGLLFPHMPAMLSKTRDIPLPAPTPLGFAALGIHLWGGGWRGTWEWAFLSTSFPSVPERRASGSQ